MASSPSITPHFIYFLLIASLIFTATESRPFDVLKSFDCSKEIDSFFNSLSFASIKNAGPSPGAGHAFVNAQTLGGVKAGPSPGEGHGFTNAGSLGGVKVSGPSPAGKGHAYTNAQTLGGIKESGSRHGDSLIPRGEGIVNIRVFGGIKAGPSPGRGHNYITGVHR